MTRDSLPRIGLGTYSDDDREQWSENVRTALDVGYRHVDTAQVYENERFVGEGLRAADVDREDERSESSEKRAGAAGSEQREDPGNASGETASEKRHVSREDVFLSTKTVHHDVPSDPDAVPDAIDGCLERLGVDRVDLLYVHWPSGIYDHDDVLPAYDDAYDAGKTRHVGLSNFTPELLDEAREVLDAPLFAHQVEMHPLLPQEELVAYAQEHDHWLVAYSPLAKGEVFDVPEIQRVAEKHDATPAQVSLAWLCSHDNVATIPKASSRDHMAQNLAALDLELDADDIETIDSIDRRHRVIDPDHGPWNW